MGENILLASLLDISEPDGGEPALTKLCPVGTVARIKQLIRTPDGETRLIAEGLCRATISSITPLDEHTIATVVAKTVVTQDDGGVEGEAYLREANFALRQVVRFIPAVAEDIMTHVSTIRNPGLYADFVAANILVRYEDKQAILECFDPMVRIDTLILIMRHEADVLSCESDIRKRVRERINRSQREYFLREEIKVIQDELGEGGSDTDEYFERIMGAELPAEVQKKLLRENERLAKLPFGSAEASVLTNYLDTCLEIPWKKTTTDRVNIEAARKVLDADHDGLEKVKERILEYMAVKQLSPDLKNQILCLVGPPGVGKTSIAASIARAMKRKYIRVSLGGVRDESDIRGHRKTYVGAMPGRIITALTQVGVKNPLILLDEVDKLTRDAHGDPSSALLEVLDPEQNRYFRDHFVELPYDLSDCLFIATANSLNTIPKPLIDRMEIIELSSYTRREKVSIAMNHLIPKQLKKHGLNKRSMKITPDAVEEIIDYYTREAGVRNLERSIAALCRKGAKKLLETPDLKHVTVKAEDVRGYLGPHRLTPEHVSAEDETGVVNGLAYTEAGGDMLRIECAVLDGTGKLELTGSLGDVMKESAEAATTFLRSQAKQYHFDPDFLAKHDIHIHVPDGATPKDGPSAGVTLTTALLSALIGKAPKSTLCMTGEIDIKGRVLPVGGIKEKILGAVARGLKEAIIPWQNKKDLYDIPKDLLKKIRIHPVHSYAEVAKLAFTAAALKGRTAGKRGKEQAPAVPLEQSLPGVRVTPEENEKQETPES